MEERLAVVVADDVVVVVVENNRWRDVGKNIFQYFAPGKLFLHHESFFCEFPPPPFPCPPHLLKKC